MIRVASKTRRWPRIPIPDRRRLFASAVALVMAYLESHGEYVAEVERELGAGGIVDMFE